MQAMERKAVRKAKSKADQIGWQLDHLPQPAAKSDPRWAALEAAEGVVKAATARESEWFDTDAAIDGESTRHEPPCPPESACTECWPDEDEARPCSACNGEAGFCSFCGGDDVDAADEREARADDAYDQWVDDGMTGDRE